MEVFVFKTNISSPEITPIVESYLRQHTGIARWNIDFGDRDKVLRIEAQSLQPAEIIRSITSAGFQCEELT